MGREKQKKKRKRRRRHSSSSVSEDEETTTKNLKRSRSKRRRKRTRSPSTSSSSSSSSSSASSSTSDSSSSSDEKRQRKKRKKSRKTQSKGENKDMKKTDEQGEEPACDIPLDLMEKSKTMAPMTKEQWEEQQSKMRRVFDESTGRWRLIKGSGEVVEEIVSRERHKAINQQATRGDGEFFQAKLLTGRK